MSEWCAVFRVTKDGSFSQASLYNIYGDKSPHTRRQQTRRRSAGRSNTARNNFFDRFCPFVFLDSCSSGNCHSTVFLISKNFL